MDENEIMKRFFDVVSDSIKEKDEFMEDLVTAIDVYYNNPRFRGHSLELGNYLAYCRYIIGEYTLNSMIRTWGCKDYTLPRFNKWLTDCLNECGGIKEEKKRQIEAELKTMFADD